jgi:hypothetical protein
LRSYDPVSFFAVHESRHAELMLGDVTRAELEALDLEGRRRKVRAVVERVVLGPQGPSVVPALGGAASTLQTEPAELA